MKLTNADRSGTVNKERKVSVETTIEKQDDHYNVNQRTGIGQEKMKPVTTYNFLS